MAKKAGKIQIESLTERGLVEMTVELLEAEGFTSVAEPHLGDLGADILAKRPSRKKFETWAIECKAVALSGAMRALRSDLLKLSSYQRLSQADKALLVTTASVPTTLVDEIAKPLGIEIWDLPVLQSLLAKHPSVARDLARAAEKSINGQVGAIKLLDLELENFRGFSQLALDLDAPVVVVVGVNGAGKSSILDAVAMALSWPIRRIMTSNANGMPFGSYDLHRGCSSGSTTLRAQIAGAQVSWSIVGRGRPTKNRAPGRRSALAELTAPVHSIHDALAENPGASVPVCVYYPVNRAVLDIPQRIRKKHDFSQLSAYEGALESGGRDFRLFFEWFRQREDLENEKRLSRRAYRDAQLEAVRRAIHALIPSFSNLRVSRNPLRMLVDKDGETLVVNQLSDGEKCLLAMVGDLARRLAIANPSLKDPLGGSGVVLIDEIELHLHPTWQRAIIPRLKATFPSCQFLVSTHSPQVIGNVEHSAVKLLEDFQLVPETPHTKGRDASSILADVMGMARHPPDVAAKLRRIGELIEDEELDEARILVDDLARDLGSEDAEIVRQRALIGFLED